MTRKCKHIEKWRDGTELVKDAMSAFLAHNLLHLSTKHAIDTFCLNSYWILAKVPSFKKAH